MSRTPDDYLRMRYRGAHFFQWWAKREVEQFRSDTR